MRYAQDASARAEFRADNPDITDHIKINQLLSERFAMLQQKEQQPFVDDFKQHQNAFKELISHNNPAAKAKNKEAKAKSNVAGTSGAAAAAPSDSMPANIR